ncbi:ATP-binding protein [Winogradskyella sp. UBA3174]|uniref:ATP-binding protein n=1 Tax=Winogradskyella sp. UBA3174 TaxID=1947785 RepID=UPI0025CF1221|nr:ATP-binding protein [Winogradskyella sp. UBA3174]|tara:strand:+ start:23 stop:547 length:525 start_codon:yes stop_codon:yes gene_type:complete
MKDRNIIFIGGIHAVGKGTVCEKITQKFNFEHLSASQVLKWNEISDLKNKKVENFNTTQDRLLTNLDKITQPNKRYLLDGHFTLLNSKGEPEKIDESTFVGIQPKSIILLTCEPKIIFERLKKRDNSTYKLDVLEKMQTMEIEHAKYISRKLDIPLFTVIDGDTTSIFEYLEKL